CHRPDTPSRRGQPAICTVKGETLRRKPAPSSGRAGSPPSRRPFPESASESSAYRCSPWTQVLHGPDLLLRLSGAARENGAADGMGGCLHHRAGGREVIGEAVVHQLAGTKAGSIERPPET